MPALGWKIVTLITIAALFASDDRFNLMMSLRASCTYPANPSTSTTRETRFSYDVEGRLAQVNSHEGVINYEYDLAYGRLTRTCTTNSEVAYGYDWLGRLQSVTLNKRNGTNITAETTTYSYTKVGNRASVTLPNGVVTTYQYDNLNRVAVNGTTAGTYDYNDQGIRVRENISGKKYLIDANNHTGYAQVLEEFNNANALTMSYVIGDDVLGQSTSTTPRWLLYDGHGSTRQLITAGEVSSRYNYEAYGTTLGTSSMTAEASVNNNITRLLYCGEQYDSGLGMYNLRSRFYHPGNGRFNARDTFMGNNHDPQSLHKYAYCNSDPVNGIDPSGNFTLVEILMVVAILLVLVTTFYSFNSNAKKVIDPAMRVPQFEKLVDLKMLSDDKMKSFVDKMIIGAAELSDDVSAQKLASITTSISLGNKFAKIGAFFRDAKLLMDEQRQKAFLAACEYAGREPQNIDQVSQALIGKSWNAITDKEDVIAIGNYIINTSLSPDGLTDYIISVENLIEQGASIAY